MSVIELARSWGYKVVERRISIDEVYDAYISNELKEAFGTGTAAVVSPIGKLKWKDKIMEINSSKTGNIAKRIYDSLTDIQWGKVKDNMHWTVEI